MLGYWSKAVNVNATGDVGGFAHYQFNTWNVQAVIATARRRGVIAANGGNLCCNRCLYAARCKCGYDHCYADHSLRAFMAYAEC